MSELSKETSNFQHTAQAIAKLTPEQARWAISQLIPRALEGDPQRYASVIGLQLIDEREEAMRKSGMIAKAELQVRQTS